MSYLKYSDKVIGFYCCEEKDKNGTPYKLYCYVILRQIKRNMKKYF